MELTSFNNIKYPMVFLKLLSDKINNHKKSLDDLNDDLLEEPDDIYFDSYDSDICSDESDNLDIILLNIKTDLFGDISEKCGIEDEILISLDTSLFDDDDDIVIDSKSINMIKKNKITIINDDLLYYLLKYFLYFFHPFLINIKTHILFKDHENTHKKSYILLKTQDDILSSLYKKLINIREYKEKISKNLLKANFDSHINYWIKKLDKLKAINDASVGSSFISKLIHYDDLNYIYTGILTQKLMEMMELLGLSFFIKNKIKVITYEEFNYYSDEKKIKFFIQVYRGAKNTIGKNIKRLEEIKKYRDALNFLYS